LTHPLSKISGYTTDVTLDVTERADLYSAPSLRTHSAGLTSITRTEQVPFEKTLETISVGLLLDGSQIKSVREFQAVGQATEKVRQPIVGHFENVLFSQSLGLVVGWPIL